MTRFLVAFLVVALGPPGGAALAAQATPPAIQAAQKKTRRPATQPAPPVRPAAPSATPRVTVRKDSDERDTRFYSYKLNTFLGTTVSRTSALALGAQLGHVIDHSTPFYVGPEVNFSLFSPGNVIQALASAWYEMRIFGSPRLSLAVGGALGAAFTSSIVNVPGLTYAAFFEGVIAQDIDDLVAVRGQFRPGVIGGYFAFMMNLSVQFRFL